MKSNDERTLQMPHADWRTQMLENNCLPTISPPYANEKIMHLVNESYSFADNLAPLRIPFQVAQNPNLPIPTLEQTKITPQQYRWMHALNVAVTLTAVQSLRFPGMRSRGIAYPFEYSDMDGNASLNRDFTNEMRKLNKDMVRLIEIGGQQGRWQYWLHFLAKSSFDLQSVNLDLDLSTREAFPSKVNPEDECVYIQGDAHDIERILQKCCLRHPDVIAMMNVDDVMFDPISVLKKAWDLLNEDGLLAIGDSHYSVKLPFIPLHNNKIVPLYAHKEESMDLVTGKEQQKILAEWLHANKKLAEVIPTSSEFIYNSANHDLNSPEIAAVVQHLKQIPPLEYFNLKVVMDRLGADFKLIKGGLFGTGNGRLYIFKKSKGAINPFSYFRPYGIGYRNFHCGEYLFPQLYYRVEIPS